MYFSMCGIPFVKVEVDVLELLVIDASCACRIDNWKTEQIEQFLREKVISKSSL